MISFCPPRQCKWPWPTIGDIGDDDDDDDEESQFQATKKIAEFLTEKHLPTNCRDLTRFSNKENDTSPYVYFQFF